MEVDIPHPETNSTSSSGQVIKTEEEEILVYVNVDDANDDFIAEDLNSFKVIGLDTDEPIIQVGDKFFGGSWNEVVGTAVFFKETAPQPKRCYFSADVPKPLEYIGKTQKSLNLKRAFITELKGDSDKEYKPNESNSPKTSAQDSIKTEPEVNSNAMETEVKTEDSNTPASNSFDVTRDNPTPTITIKEENNKDL